MHSHINHLYALLETAKEIGVPHTYVHFLGDGRDTAPRSATIYLKNLLEFMKKEEYGELATIIGRYYAMDRDKRWERIKIAVEGLVKGTGEVAEDPIKAVESNYEKDVTDEFLQPIIVNGDAGRIKGDDYLDCLVKIISDVRMVLPDGDTLFFFNYRSDRMREIVSVMGLPDKPVEVDIPANLVCICPRSGILFC